MTFPRDTPTDALEARLAGAEMRLAEVEAELAKLTMLAGLGPICDPYPERRSPEYCWRSWPPRHTDECGCDIARMSQ